MKNNKIFMAFSTGKESAEEEEIKKYIGIAPVSVLAVNPSRSALESIYGNTIKDEPVYLSEIDQDDKKVQQVRIDFIIRTDKDRSNGIDLISKLSFFIRNSYRFNKDKSKIQIIDKYGRTAWATVHQVENHEIPTYSNGLLANIDKDYRPCYYGEEELVYFLKLYLGIPNVMKYVNDKWVMVDNPSECEASLDHIKDYFTGDFSELSHIVSLQPNNKIKCMFGIKNVNGTEYQVVYNQEFAWNNSHNYSRLIKSLEEKKNAGAYSSVSFDTCDLQEYSVKSTDFTEINSSDPFSEDGNISWFS